MILYATIFELQSSVRNTTHKHTPVKQARARAQAEAEEAQADTTQGEERDTTSFFCTKSICFVLFFPVRKSNRMPSPSSDLKRFSTSQVLPSDGKGTSATATAAASGMMIPVLSSGTNATSGSRGVTSAKQKQRMDSWFCYFLTPHV